MKSPANYFTVSFAIALVFTLLTSTPVWPGGSDDEAPDAHQDHGPNYFGFVKDTTGKAVPDAKVTAEIKGKGSVIARTNAAGAYKLPGFGKEIQPANVLISCAKDGYKQARVLTRTPLNKKPLIAVEIECTLQKVGTK
ncbi:MAG: carboxypeptidase regulatory-like domain-containing protein [Deltaproteobacteria bacterium]|nr:carboxypeptidase regulatory-like domain-containing protein [Deltaproteobacteria bacterium]